MKIDGILFYKAQLEIKKVFDVIDGNKNKIDDLINSAPPKGYPWKSKVNEICNDLVSFNLDVCNLSKAIENARLNIISLQGSEKFIEEYGSMITNISFGNEFGNNVFGFSGSINESIIKLSDDDYYEYLYSYLKSMDVKLLNEDQKNILDQLEASKKGFKSVEEMKKWEQAKVEYEQMNLFQQALSDTRTFLCSTACGIISVAEEIVDGYIMLESSTLLYTSPIGWGINAISFFQEKSGISKDRTLKSKYQDVVQDIINYNFSDNLYDSIVDSTGLNIYSAYGTCHTAGLTLGNIVAEVGIQFIPGGNISLFALHALKAAGKTSQKAIKEVKKAEKLYLNGDISAEEYNDIMRKKSFGHIALTSGANAVLEGGISTILYGKFGFAKETGGKAVNFVAKKIQPLIKSKKASEVVVKSAISFSKEFAKEGISSVGYGKKYNLKETMKSGLTSVATTVFNETVVAPLTDKVINKEGINSKKAFYKQENSKLKHINSNVEENIKTTQEKLSLIEAKRAALFESGCEGKESIKGVFGNYESPKPDHVVAYDDVIKKYTGKITIQQNIISQNNDAIGRNSLNVFEKLVNNGAITKISKKIASKFVKDIIANAMK